MVLSIAETPMRRVEDDIPYIAKTIADNYFDSDLTSGFVTLASQMYVSMEILKNLADSQKDNRATTENSLRRSHHSYYEHTQARVHHRDSEQDLRSSSETCRCRLLERGQTLHAAPCLSSGHV